MSDTPQAFDIVAGPSLREIELAMTDPWPLGRPASTDEAKFMRKVKFSIIAIDGRTVDAIVEIWMIRHVGLPTDDLSETTKTSLDLGLVMRGFDARHIFNPTSEPNEELEQRFDDEYDIGEIAALYDYERKRGRIVLTNPPWRQLRP